MEPLDAASGKLKALIDEVTQHAYWTSILTEADTRLKLIDRIFVEILGWPYTQIHLESNAGKKFIDYRCTIESRNRLIIEAKREGRDLGINADHASRFFKLNGTTFNSEAAREGIEQAINYCAHKSAELACVTNGRQWAIFRGAKDPDGTDILEGSACVFGSLDAVLTKFQNFYELLAYEHVANYGYRAIFRQAEGQPIRRTSAKVAARSAETKQLLRGDKISVDLDRIMQSFFRDLGDQDDAEARRECFVTTDESSVAEQGLTRISEELRNKVRSLSTADSSELTEAIRRVQEMKKNELILLVGTKGAGKSTFIDRFFTDVLPSDVRQDCVIVRVDLSKSGGTANVTKWLDEHFLDAAEKAAFPDGPPTYEEIQGMFFGEYKRWMEGHAKHLYESDKTQFKIDFGRHVETFRRDRPHEYINHLLFRIVQAHTKIPCLVFDNADHFNVPFQEEVFNFAHSIYQEAICLVILPITDTTSWQLSKQGPIQSFYTDSFFLPTPPTELVLRRRIEYIEKQIAKEQEESGKKPETGRGYFFSRGMRLEIENIRGFAACLQTLFLNTGHVAEWIGCLANHDIRRCLQFTREIVASPQIHTAELVAAHVAKTSMTVNSDDIKMAIIRGRYDIYYNNVHSYVQNLFDLVPESETTPLLSLRVLQLLNSAYQGNSANDGRYLPINDIAEYFHTMNIDARATRACLDAMLKRGLCLSYDPTTDGIRDTIKVEIAPSGAQHLAWAQRDWVYLESMAEVTPLYDAEASNSIRADLKADLPHLRRAAISTFIQYIIQEDAHFCIVPKHESYQEQGRIRSNFQHQLSTLSTAATSPTVTRHKSFFGRVTTWNTAKGYGFVRQHSGEADIFLHIRNVLNAKEGQVPPGVLVEYDIEISAQRPQAILATVHFDRISGSGR